MSEKLTIRYFPENEFSKEPFQPSEDGAGYDVFASEAKTILPKTVACIRLDFKMVIPKGFYGNLFPRSGLLKQHLVSRDAGVIDQIIWAVLRSCVSIIIRMKFTQYELLIELVKLFSCKDLV